VIWIELAPLALPIDPSKIGNVLPAQHAWIDACGPIDLPASRVLATTIPP
jgi:hypothetical protein